MSTHEFKIVVDQETATKEVENYIKRRVIKPLRLSKLADAKDNLIEAVMYGWLTINDDGTIIQNLLEPVGEYKSIKYKYRVPADVIEMEKQRTKGFDATQNLLIYWSSYTDEQPNLYRKLEPMDKDTADSLTLFFM